MGKWLKFHLLLILTGLAISIPSVSQEHEKLASLYIDQAIVSYERDDAERAYQLLLSAVRFMPDNSDAHYLLARLDSLQPGGLYPAVEKCREALSLGTWNRYSPLECTILLAELFVRTGHFSDADTLLRENFPGEDPGADYYAVKANAHTGLGDTEESIQLLEQALRKYPEVAQLRQQLSNLSPSYRRKLANEYAEGRYKYDHDESVLLDLIKDIPDPDQQDDLIGVYLSRGGMSPWVDIAQIASADEEKDISDLLDSFVRRGGVGEGKLIDALIPLIQDGPNLDYVLELTNDYSGAITVDDNDDGYREMEYRYENGLPVRVSIDLDQDGLYEFDAKFNNGIPTTLFGIVDKHGVEINYTNYPFAETITVRSEGKSVIYSIPPGEFSYPLFDFRFLESPGPLNRPRLNPHRPDVTLDILLSKASSIREEINGASGMVFLWEYMPDVRRWQKKEVDAQGRVLKKITYLDGSPLMSNVDTNRDGDFEVTYQYDQGNIAAILFDENGDAIPEYSMIFQEGDVRRWDFNGDSIIDCREEVKRNGEILRTFSSSFDGVFDMEILYKDNRIVWIERDGMRKEVRPDSTGHFYWVGEEIQETLEVKPEPGVIRLGKSTLSVFNQFGYTYVEVLE